MKIHGYSVIMGTYIVFLVFVIGNRFIFVRCISLGSLQQKGVHKEELVNAEFKEVNTDDKATKVINKSCHATDQFLHPVHGCTECRDVCNRTKTTFCSKNCPYYCTDGFFHVPSNQCVHCEFVCRGNMRSHNHKKFCDKNCSHLTSYCKPDEFPDRNNTCKPCASVCGPDKRRVFCQQNCRDYLLNKTRSDPILSSVKNNNSTVHIGTRIEFLPAIIFGVTLALLTTATTIIVCILCKKKFRKRKTTASKRRESHSASCQPVEETRKEREETNVDIEDPLLASGGPPMDVQPSIGMAEVGENDSNSKTYLKELLPTQATALQYEDLDESGKLGSLN